MKSDGCFRESGWISPGERGFVDAMRDWETTRRRLLGVARGILSNEEDAKDAVQDALVSAYEARARFRGEALWSTWMHRIVVNTCLMKIRSRRHRREVSLESKTDGLLDAAAGRQRIHERADVALELREQATLVHLTIGRLPEPYRTVVRLRDIDGYDTLEAAIVLGVTPNTVKVRLHRARKALRGLLLGSAWREPWRNARTI